MPESSLSVPGSSAATRAFTLIELLTVIAIVGVLAGIVIGMGRRASTLGKTARAKAEIAALASALESFRQQFGDFPQVVGDAAASTQSGQTLFAALNGWRGPGQASANFATRKRVFFSGAALTLADANSPDVATNHFLDPWGNPYHYAYGSSSAGWRNPSFVLFSSGPDGLSLAVTATGYVDSSASENVDNLYANQ